MGFDPDAYLASAAPATPAAPAPAGGFDPDAYLAGPAAAPSLGESVVRGAAQGASLGFADEATALGKALLIPQDIDNQGTVFERYQRMRDQERAKYAAARAAHPTAYGLAELGGGIAAPVPGGAAKTVLGAAGRAAVAGGLAGLGTSDADLTRGELGHAARDVALGAGTAAVVGGAVHAIGARLAKGAEDRYISDVATDTVGRARPKDQLQARRIFMADQGDADIAARDVLFSQEVRPIVKAARSGKTAEARDLIASKLDELSPAREADYATIDRHVGGAKVGTVLEHFDDEIGRLRTETGNTAMVKVLGAVRNDIEQTWSGVQVGTARAALRGALETAEPHEAGAIEEAIAKLPKRGDASVTAKELRELTAGIPAKARAALDSLPRAPDASIRVPTVDLRHAVTTAQTEAVASLGTIAETEHAKLKAASQAVLENALKGHLDAAAARGGEAARAVRMIRNRDKWYTTLLAMDRGLEQRAGKELLQKKTLTDQVAAAARMHGPMAAVPLALTGHIPAAIGAAALPVAIKGAQAGARGVNDTIARLMYAASKGDLRAQRLLQMAGRVPAASGRVAAEQAVAAAQP